MKRLEMIVGSSCAAIWAIAMLLLAAGGVELSRFPPPRAVFSFAAIVGWISGNVFMSRLASRALPRRGLVAIYLGGPPSLIWLLWACIPVEIQRTSPLVPLLSLGIYGIFFLVPVTLRRR